MIEIPNDPVKVAEAAMEFELEGRRILESAGEKAKDPLSKATFQFLADQELKHIEVIKAFTTALTNEESFDTSAIDECMSKEEACKLIRGIYTEFKSKFDQVSELDAERLKIYDVAEEMERHGHAFYECAANQAQDEQARKLYAFLAAEEIKHFEIIQETHDYLSQPDAFMAADENWMTT